ncbi:efflux RND transporter periplasmic adaptor subunit [Roseateles flavus]|uniref:Efflux RND transporter periplasmic adaptor subunit n=1 Tax=Roseateles flavus TaxID=3149041 RepID=A0ABV0GLE6_9BURK
MSKSKKWAAAAAIALVLVVPVGVKLARGKQVKDVETEKVVLRAPSPSILASGTLVYESQVTLVPEIIARVNEVLVKEGDAVRKGQLLIRLEDESPRAETLQLQASLRQSELQVERQRVNLEALTVRAKRYAELRRHDLVEPTKYDEMQAQVDLAAVELRTGRETVKQAQAQLRQAQDRLAKTEIHAPIDGKVTLVSIKPGETAVPAAVSIAGSTLMTIADTRSTFAEINVDETDVARLSKGQGVRIVPAAFPDRAFRGRVEQVAMAPKQNPGQSRSYPVRVKLENEGLPFHPGMSCRAEIAVSQSGEAKNPGVPVQAVHYESSEGRDDKTRAFVFVMDNRRAVRRPVEIGLADDTFIEVTRGLKTGETVITGPAKTLRFLSDGEAVRSQDRAEARDSHQKGGKPS